jgi:hypothetical protein
MIRKALFISLLLSNILVSAREYHVSPKGNDSNAGNSAKPFRTVGAAAKVAYAGDTVTVHEGVYREWVNPVRGGESDTKRIIYRAAPGEKVFLKGSEVITGWKKENNVWKVVIPNSFFGSYNPYQDSVFGDWFNRHGRVHHTGEVFLNGKSLYEKESLRKVIESIPVKGIADSTGSTYTWYCESDSLSTVIWANFHNLNPNRELVEIAARRTCFYPDKPGINFLTIRGFDISQAATQWAAPTAEQVGMISTNWNKGWIIENNIIHDSKCNGITLGKEKGTGHNVWSADRANVNNDGNIHYIEVVFRVLRNGWNKENIGSHIVRNNQIYNCEQTGICGSMGVAFSIIENNHIYNIWTKRQFSGAEIAGIKFHAAIDVTIKKNRINNCGRGLWLDWMAQGARVSSNLFYNNDQEDLFLEVNHGPFVVDNNIMLSKACIRTQSEGGTFAHNLVAGYVYAWPDNARFTPYFLPHSTDIAGLTTIFGGDDRWYNNIFIGAGKPEAQTKYKYGLESYNNARLPVWMRGNCYYNSAKPSDMDKESFMAGNTNPDVKLLEEGNKLFLSVTPDEGLGSRNLQLITTGMLGIAKIPKAKFENPDGSELKLDSDYLGKPRSASAIPAGPFAEWGKGKQLIRVW